MKKKPTKKKIVVGSRGFEHACKVGEAVETLRLKAVDFFTPLPNKKYTFKIVNREDVEAETRAGWKFVGSLGTPHLMNLHGNGGFITGCSFTMPSGWPDIVLALEQ